MAVLTITCPDLVQGLPVGSMLVRPQSLKGANLCWVAVFPRLGCRDLMGFCPQQRSHINTVHLFCCQ